MIWLLRDFDLVAILLRCVTLSLEAVSVGGVFFLLCCKPGGTAVPACRRLLITGSIGLAIAELVSMAVAAAMLFGEGSGSPANLFSASFLRAELLSIMLALTLAWLARRRTSAAWMMLPALPLVASTVWLSHAVARMDDRWLLAGLTALHHLGTAAWLGAMPYLLLTLRSYSRAEMATSAQQSELVVRRFSRVALISVAVLVLAGIGMSWFYVGSISGLYGTTYGVLLLVKIYLLLLMLSLGGANWYLLRRASALPSPLLLRLRRFSEAEIGIGFTVLLAAASLSAQPPAIDVTQDRATKADYVQRLRPEWPRLESPPLSTLTAPSPIDVAIQQQQFQGLSPSDANDMAWSEYNHHWAGLAVFAAGLFALLSRIPRMRWARYWPLAFLGLAVFIVLRADPEAWPLGPRPFWASFSAPDTLEHRFYALLITLFAAFECAVQSGRLRAKWAVLILPGTFALGGALLLTHGHGSEASMKEEVLANVSHTLIALLGITAGWSRWLEVRLQAGRARRVAGALWPAAIMLAGMVLVSYREM